MTSPDESTEPKCIDTAVQFVADQPGGADRTLARHRRLPDGACAGCLSHPTRWPCTAAAIAQRARRAGTTPRP